MGHLRGWHEQYGNALYISSVIRQKGESQNKCFKKIKHAKFSEKLTFLIPRYAHVQEPIRRWEMFLFSKICVLCFLETPILRFALLPYYRRYKESLYIFSKNIFLQAISVALKGTVMQIWKSPFMFVFI